jgi:ectoine hydroxylase-related dioxygenase (phytanoyl-CoA dioxygenase family)
MITETEFDTTLLPTEDDIARYERTGWYISRDILSDDLLDRARVAIEAHHRGHRDRTLSRTARFSDWKPGDGDGVRNNEFCSLQNDGVCELVMQPILGAIAARLARCDTIRVFDDQAIWKPPASGEVSRSAVGWHTDHSYWSTCTSTRMLTAWVPLHDTEERNGTLYVITGSHLWPEAENLRDFNNPDLDGIERRMGRAIPQELIVPMLLRKGQVSFHHMRAIHASSPNAAGRPRYAVAVHMQDGGNRYREFRTADGTKVVLPHDQLCRIGADGHPDYTDPEVFPVIWPREGD